MKQKKSSSGRGGLAHFGSVVTLAPARAATSHVRRIYHRRYRGRYKRARLIFSFDLFLVGVIASLLMFILAVNYSALLKRESGLQVNFVADEFRALQPVPVLIQVLALDNKEHSGVSLRLSLPPWVEVVETHPKSVAGEIFLGQVTPEKSAALRAVLLIRAQRNATLPIGFTVSEYDPLFLSRSFSGMEKRSLGASTVTLRPLVEPGTIQAGGALPLVVENFGSTTGSSLGVRMTEKSGAPNAQFLAGADFVEIGALGPGQKKIILAGLGQAAESSVGLNFELTAQANVIDRLATHFAVMDAPPLAKVVSDGWRLKLQKLADMTVRAVLLAPDATEFGRAELTTSSPSVILPGGNDLMVQALPWAEIGGQNFIGAPLDVRQSDRLTAACSARYFAESGDQLGVGPLPLRSGERTSVWVVCSVGAANQTLKNFTLTAEAGRGVTFSGMHSAAQIGQFTQASGGISWAMPEIGAVDTGGQPVAFEVVVKPTADQIGTTPILLTQLSLSAEDVESGKKLEAGFEDLKLEFKPDDKAFGKGYVVGK